MNENKVKRREWHGFIFEFDREALGLGIGADWTGWFRFVIVVGPFIFGWEQS